MEFVKRRTLRIAVVGVVNVGQERAATNAVGVEQKIAFRVILYGALNHGQQRDGTRWWQFKHTHGYSLDESHTSLIRHVLLPLVYH